MTNVAAVGVNDHRTHMPMPEVSSSSLINRAAPTAITSTITEKMAALLLSPSLVNTFEALPPPEKRRDVPAGRQ
jgi:hypothetical protein